MHKTAVIAVCLALFLSANYLFADIIYLKSGKTIEGQILSETTDQIGVKTNTSSFYVRKTDIERIEKTQENKVNYVPVITAVVVVAALVLGMVALVAAGRKQR